jgi:selenocysteine lyase/cysteine desulfurase
VDVEAIRSRFSALQVPTAFFDGPGGTQVPDTVIEAVAGYFRESNANTGGPFGNSRRTDALIAQARLTAAAFLRCDPGEVARDLDLRVQLVDIHDDTTIDYDDLERKLSERTRVVAFPLAANAVGTTPDARRIVELAHGVGALAWADAVHYGPHGPIDVADLGIDVLLCSPYKYFGPHLGLAFVRAELTASLRTYKVRPADHPYETGTLAHELLTGFVAAVEYIESVGWSDIQPHERTLGQRFLDGLPDRCTLHGLPTMDGRVPTFAFTVDGLTPRVVAERLAQRDIAVWDGNYYAVEVMERLGLGDDGAVRAGFVHYNTAAEVDRLLEALEAM